MEISLVFPVHPSEEILEAYAFGRLSDDRLSDVEEHLLVCEACQGALDYTEQYIQLMKTATAQAPQPERRGWLSIPAGTLARTGTWVGGLAFAGLMAVMWLPPGKTGSPAPVALQSYRGDAVRHGEDAAVNLAPALRPLNFSIRAEDVPAKPEYRIEVVTDAGRTLWAGSAKTGERELTAHMTPGLSAGHYWVRLYDQDSGLLTEFGLRLK